MCIMEFKLHSKYQPTGDQPQTIEKLVNSINAGNREQTLLGVTGSGKTFTMANVIQKVQRPTLVLAHNKTLAAQLCSEFKEFFPDNAAFCIIGERLSAYIFGKNSINEIKSFIFKSYSDLVLSRHFCAISLNFDL